MTPVLMQVAEKALRQHLADLLVHMDDPTVQEVMVNSPCSVWIERAGVHIRVKASLTETAIDSAIQALANINSAEGTNLLDARLPSLRIAAARKPVAAHGPSLCIRRHSSRVLSLSEYAAAGSLDSHWPSGSEESEGELPGRPAAADVAKGGSALADMLTWMMRTHSSVLVAGPTSSGKTTFLNALAQQVDMSERVATLEDTCELQITSPNWIAFEANQAADIGLRRLVKHVLRCRPHRLFVGECRGAEAFDMLDAFGTGHPGAFTMHASSAIAALYRLENMVRMATEAANWPLADLRRQIASVFRWIVVCGSRGAARGPIELAEVVGVADGAYQLTTLFNKT